MKYEGWIYGKYGWWSQIQFTKSLFSLDFLQNYCWKNYAGLSSVCYLCLYVWIINIVFVNYRGIVHVLYCPSASSHLLTQIQSLMFKKLAEKWAWHSFRLRVFMSPIMGWILMIKIGATPTFYRTSLYSCKRVQRCTCAVLYACGSSVLIHMLV